MPRHLNTVLEDFYQTAFFLSALVIYEGNKRILKSVFMYLAEFFHCFRLCIVQKTEQHFTVNCITTVKIGGISDGKAVTVAEYFK